MQTPDGWMTVAEPQNMRTGAASCLQKLNFSEEGVRLTGSLVIGKLIVRASRRCKKEIMFALKFAARSHSFKHLNREKCDVFCIDLW